MSLFQKSVEKKYLNELDSALIDKKFAEFKAYFGNPERQENIRNSKEEQFQEGFLRELFVKILDYTLNPEPNFNLTTELKNVSDSKKADGAILRNENAIAVIELKSTDTTDLGKVESQAFGYKNHHPKCVYVITSNFEKLRFYIQNAVNHFEFDLFKLTKEEFSLLWLCLAKENLLSDLPLKIKESSLVQEENITKQLYSDYSKFRESLYLNLVKNNPEIDKLTLFKKTQKLIDRFLFIFFAEDKQLLPANSIIQIIEKWKDDVDFGDTKPLYSLFKQYFHILNVGRPKSEKRQEIFAYNGGLFLTDDILENVKIDDDVLKEHTLKLSNYDFDTDVDVNILGHIFEHSLGEIENVQAEIKGEQVDVQKTKRKKDGIFYTPKYITKYIVENTVGKLCEAKRNELKIVDEEYAKGRKNRRKETIKELDEKIKKYQEWLLSLTILDPACGSGAFLNQALEFLIEEHKKIDELRAQLLGGSLVFSDISTDILEKNIYGVDINEESVEIAKLSLWLRTARKGRKLNTLSNNIKCGNSLIDDPEIAGDKAFNWQNEFPEIFAKGGFDVVIGNPPYVFTRGNEHLQLFNNYIWSNYNHNHGKINLYSVFLELSISKLLKEKGKLGFITPETFIRTSTYSEIRKFIINSFLIESINIYGIGVFDNVTAETITMIISKEFNISNNVRFYKHKSIENYDEFLEKQNDFNKTPENRFLYGSDDKDRKLFEKIKKEKPVLGDFIDVRNGIATKSGKNDYISNTKIDDKFKKLLEAPDIFRYGFDWPCAYINYDKDLLHRPRKEETFLSKKILIQRVSSRLVCAYDDENYYTFNSINNLVLKQENSYSLHLLLGILNSHLIDFFYRRNYSLDANYTITVTKTNLDSLPIPHWSENNPLLQGTITLVCKVIDLNKKNVFLKNSFLNLIINKFDILKPTSNLKNWYSLESNEFLKEFKKMKIQISLNQEAELLQYFNEQKNNAMNLNIEIEKLESEINKLVYSIYELSDEEIRIVESSI